MTFDLDLDALLEAARKGAAVGAAVVLDAYGAARNVRSKGPGDWVSDADTSSEHAIRAVLHDAAPDLAFFGEETGGDRADVGWFVDPLDGTANFVHGFPVVGVSVALVADGQPVVGVIEAPMLGLVYAARLGGGATCNDDPIRVSRRDPEESICATGFPFRAKRDRLPQYFPVFERALLTFEDLRRAGAASLDLSWTAAGVLDGYFEQALGTWDVAAGALLVREAGGVVTDWQGDDRDWLRSGDVVAGSGPVHERLLELIAGPGRALV
jgi:myo-inositol-1(or 4)-monophosphatase